MFTKYTCFKSRTEIKYRNSIFNADYRSDMDELKLIFASNLIRLRNQAGMTQAELAERLHYSDKSVSKWERGEAVPDAYVLKSLAEIFSVTLDQLLSDDSGWKKPHQFGEEREEYSRSFIILCSIATIWTLCVLEFVLVWMLLDSVQWIVFVAALPISLITLLVFNSVWYKGKNNMYIVGTLVLCLIVLIYLSLLEFNFWQLFLIIIPAEIVVYLAFHIRRRSGKARKIKDSTGSRE